MNKEEIQEFVDEDINPSLAMHNGYLKIVSVENGVVKIELSGGCQGCASADNTIKLAVENLMKIKFPNIAEVVDLTDHSSGENPYY
jgi:NFU1 iron-sulfur cluster scaffold homolog, mitochondrial